MKIYELIPTNNQKSFYGKALVKVSEDGTETLYSYGTKIISRNTEGNLKRFYNGWTATTGKHIKSFCGLSKKEFLDLPVTGNGTAGVLTNAQSMRVMLARRREH